jgi:DNA-binding transcriptional MerR regulator
MDAGLPPIPAKRYFTIGEVSELCGVKPYVLRYWEQEFAQLRPMKRRGNRRYYQHHEVLLVRRIRELLYDQGFTIVGARNRLAEAAGRAPARASAQAAATAEPGADAADTATAAFTPAAPHAGATARPALPHQAADLAVDLRAELLALRELLST